MFFGHFLANFGHFQVLKHCGKVLEPNGIVSQTSGAAMAGVGTKKFGLVYPGYPKKRDMAFFWKKVNFV